MTAGKTAPSAGRNPDLYERIFCLALRAGAGP